MGSWAKDFVVLIPSYNRLDEMKRCLESLENHTADGEYDLLIVDDCSPMRPALYDMWSVFLHRHSNWDVITTPQNGGFTKCVNYGIRHLWNSLKAYKYMLLLNNDAVVCESWLREVKDAFENDPKDVGVVANFHAVWCPDSIYPTPIGWDRPYARDGNPVDVRTRMVNELKCDSWYEEHVGFWGCVIRFDLFQRYGLFDERFQIICQDLDWSFRIGKYGWKTKVLNKPIFGHTGKTHIDLLDRDFIDKHVEQDDRLIREIWPEKWN